jgi:hypothetical protein
MRSKIILFYFANFLFYKEENSSFLRIKLKGNILHHKSSARGNTDEAIEMKRKKDLQVSHVMV